MKHSLHDSVWAFRDARIGIPALAVSTAGTAVTSIAAMLLLYNGGMPPLGVAAFLALLVVPTIATMGIAGRVADSMDSRLVLAVTALVQASAVTVLGFVHTAPAIFATGFVIALAQAFAEPTWSALLPRVVGDEHIGQAIAWQRGLAAVATPVGAGLGGLLVTLDDVAWGFWADAATYLLLATAALIIRTRRHGDGAAVAHVRWTAGVRVLRGDRVVWPMFVSLLVFVVLVEGINPVEVFLTRGVLHATNWQYGLSDLFAGAGSVAGAFVAGRITRNDTRARVAIYGFGGAAVMLVAMGMAPEFWTYAVILAVMAGMFDTGNATFGALMVTRTPEEQRGRVFASLNGLARSGSLLAMGLGGAANALLGPRMTFVVAGIAGALTMAAASVRVIRAQRVEARAGMPDETSQAT